MTDHSDFPLPARTTRNVDPTETIDFDPVGARPDIRPRPARRSDQMVASLIVLGVMVALVVGAVLIL